MKILALGQFYYHIPWMSRIKRFVLAGRHEVGAVMIVGDMCNILLPRVDGHRQCITIKSWIESLVVPVYYSPGAYDPAGLRHWDLPNLRRPGAHIQDGWLIHVRSIHSDSDEITLASAQSIIVSSAPPALSRTGTELDGTHHGRTDVRQDIEAAGDCRLVIHGGCIDPLARVDWCEGAMCINPAGLPYYEHRDDQPAFGYIDTETRTVNVYDGRRVQSHSFAR